LTDSIENTRATIKELDELTRQKFEEAFNRINENFQMSFRKLFGGGQAFMRLTDVENSSESGIDVIASPPGKKLQNVLLLSGGEKALTALAQIGRASYRERVWVSARVGALKEITRKSDV